MNIYILNIINRLLAIFGDAQYVNVLVMGFVTLYFRIIGRGWLIFLFDIDVCCTSQCMGYTM